MKNLSSLIQSNVPLNDKNWFQTGGPAKYFCEPSNPLEFTQALQFARQHKLNVFILGSGANLLVADDGYNGLIIRPHLKNIAVAQEEPTHVHLKVGSGLALPELITYCLDKGYSGLEEFSGIPGTVGGAVYINLHYFEFLLDQFLTEAEIIDKETGCVKKVPGQWFGFGYNQSKLSDRKHFLVSATFKLKKLNATQQAHARGRSEEIIRHRAARYPAQKTCGSFFRNFFPEEVSLIINEKKVVWVAYYLDKLGVKGSLNVGNARVSHQHANMIVNEGSATSEEIIQVARKMQTLVKNNFKLIPQPECLLIGFQEYPLLKTQ